MRRTVSKYRFHVRSILQLIYRKGKQMKSRKWKEFGKLTGTCYVDLGMGTENHEIWDRAFDVLKEIVADEKSSEPGNVAEVYLLDEITDYEYGVQEWVEDYLDDLDMRENKDKLLKVCDELLEMFCWEEEPLSDIKFLKASALCSLRRKDEAAEFCKEWLEENPDNLVAVSANVYAFLETHDMEAAEKLIKQHIHEDTECGDENDILFAAAVAYYKAVGNKKEMKRLDKAREEYDKEIGRILMGLDEDEDDEFMWDEDEEDFLWQDDDLPFS